mgnify:CR=1 FL=1
MRHRLGNVWRFPYIVGQYGGAAFVLLYLLFLVVFALPILVMEFAVGRASQKGVARSFDELEPAGSKWHRFKWAALAGNYLLMMFYTTVAGWMLAFMAFSGAGTFEGLDAGAVEGVFANRGGGENVVNIATKPMTEQYILGEMLNTPDRARYRPQVELTQAWAAARRTSSPA